MFWLVDRLPLTSSGRWTEIGLKVTAAFDLSLLLDGGKGCGERMDAEVGGIYCND
jgi:hypothetical protein